MRATTVSDAAAQIGQDPEQRSRLQRRLIKVVIASQVLGGAGLAAGITTGALLAEEMLGTSGYAGLPAGLFTLGSALTAFLVGRVSQRLGRRKGLACGFAAGGLGASGVVTAAVIDSVPLLFVALFVYGAGTATNLQTRYAGTDLALPAQRGRAISMAMVSTTLGAVAGPNMVEPLGRLAEALHIPPLAGPFLLAATAYVGAGTVLAVFLRPDPFLVAQQLAQQQAQASPSSADETLRERPGTGAVVAATTMVLTQIAMVAIMTMTPVHMRAHGHELGAIGLVIGVHIGSMYLPSLVTGVLVDKIGRIPMAIAAAVTLLLAGLTGALAPGHSLGFLILALGLLGVGWNFGLIAGTALVVDATTPSTRAKTQGSIDVLVALAGAGGGAASGMVVAGSSYATLSIAGGVLSLGLLPVMAWYRRERSQEHARPGTPTGSG